MTPPTHMGMSFAMRSRGSPDPWFSNGQSDINHYFGADAEELYRTGVPASGTITGTIAGNVLSPVSTPLYRQALTGVAGDPLGCGFDLTTGDAFVAGDASIHDYPTTNFAILTTVKYGQHWTSDRYVLGKYTLAVPRGGYGIRQSTVDIEGFAHEGIRERRVNAAGDSSNSGPWYVFFWRVHNGNLGLNSSQLGGFEVVNGGGLLTATSTGMFTLGGVLASADAVTIGPLAIWSGAEADTVIANRVANLAAWRIEAGI